MTAVRYKRVPNCSACIVKGSRKMASIVWETFHD